MTSPRSAELFFEAINQALVRAGVLYRPTTAAAVEQMGMRGGVAEVAEVEELLGLAMREPESRRDLARGQVGLWRTAPQR